MTQYDKKNGACPRLCPDYVDYVRISDVQLGEPVVVISSDASAPNSVERTAQTCETIPYEILVHIPARLQRIIT